MTEKFDDTDRRLLQALQQDASLSVDALSTRINLSRNACWRRLKRLEETGIIKARVTLMDADKLGLGLTVYMLIKTSQHDPKWLDHFRNTACGIPEIVGIYRMSGELDYIIKARITDMKAYDRLYQKLIGKVALSDVSASFVMEEIKETTEIPLFN